MVFSCLRYAEGKQTEKKGFGKDRKSKLRKFDGSLNNFSMAEFDIYVVGIGLGNVQQKATLHPRIVHVKIGCTFFAQAKKVEET